MIDDTERIPNTLSPVIYLEIYLKDYTNGKSLFQIADSIYGEENAIPMYGLSSKSKHLGVIGIDFL